MKPLFDQEKFATDLRLAMAAKNVDMLSASKEIGCSHSTISRICNGKSPDVENYLRIMRWLDKQVLKVTARPKKPAFKTPSISPLGVETYDLIAED